jgi:hypothetical protein
MSRGQSQSINAPHFVRSATSADFPRSNQRNGLIYSILHIPHSMQVTYRIASMTILRTIRRQSKRHVPRRVITARCRCFSRSKMSSNTSSIRRAKAKLCCPRDIIMHRPGIEPGAGRHLESVNPGWQRPILPLNHQCLMT